MCWSPIPLELRLIQQVRDQTYAGRKIPSSASTCLEIAAKEILPSLVLGLRSTLGNRFIEKLVHLAGSLTRQFFLLATEAALLFA
jgi:hypothetical protein